MKRNLIVLLLALVMIFTLVACGPKTPADQTPNTSPNPSASSTPSTSTNPGASVTPPSSTEPVEISVAFKYFPNGLDPLSEDSGFNRAICYHIYDRLVTFDDVDNSMSPSIAKSWKQLDGMTWELEINLDDYVFQNGDKLSMDDIVFSIERLKDIPKTADTGNRIESVTYKGNILTIKFKEENNTLMPMVFGITIIANKAYIEANGDEALFAKPIGTGPYQVAEFIPGATVVLETWDGYTLPKPQIDKITIIVAAEDAARYMALETGQVHYTAWLTPFEINLAEKDANLSTYAADSRRIGTINFNCEKAPFNNVNLRRALAYAVDRDAFSVLQGGGRPVVKAALFAGYDLFTESSNLPNFDLEKAKELLAAEGYSTSNPLRFSMMSYAPIDPGLELLQSTLKGIGVEMTIDALDIAVMMAREAAGDFDANWATPSNRGNNPLTDLDRVDIAFIGQRNTARYLNDRVQEIVARMRVTTDQNEMKQLAVEVNDIIGEEVPMVPVISYQSLAAMDKRLSGVTISGEVIYNFRNAVFAD